MQPEQLDRASQLFARLVDASSTERAKILGELGEGDASLRAHLESLLQGDLEAEHQLRELDQPFPGVKLPDRIGRFELGRRLGGGGMGVVYEARDERLDRTVAVKILHRGVAYDPLAKARFEREARAASRLDHPNICGIHDFGETGDGELYLVMPLYRGETLRERIARGRLSIDEVLSIALQLSAGLAEAHARDVVHRDIKPGNVLLTENGEVVILDFGLAMMSDLSHITREGSTMGTVAYMSPEQVMGEEVDARSDLWSLGVVLYEMLAGRPPFRGDHDQALIYNIRHEEPAAPSSLRADVPADLDRLVMGLLEKDPARRESQPLSRIERLAEEAETPELAALQRRYRVRARRRAALSVAGVSLITVVLVQLAIWMRGMSHDEGSVDPALSGASHPRVTVSSFGVHGSESLVHLGTGIASLLAARLDGMGGMTATHVEAASPESAALQETDAPAIRIDGEVVQEGQYFSVVARMASPEGAVSFSESAIPSEDSLGVRLDRIALRMLEDVLDATWDPEASAAAGSAHSLIALRAYLDGRIAVVEGRIIDGIARQIEAVSHDSTFALAWYRLERSLDIFGSTHERDFGPDIEARLKPLQLTGLNRAMTTSLASRDMPVVMAQARDAAYRHSANLPERYRLLLEARFARGLEALRLYRIMTDRFPGEAEGWYGLGIWSSVLEGNLPKSFSYHARADSLDPTFLVPLASMLSLASATRDLQALDTLLVSSVRRGLFETDARGMGDPYVLQLLDADPAETERVLASLREEGILETYWAGQRLLSMDRCDLVTDIGNIIASRADWRVDYGHWLMARCAAAKGRLMEAVKLLLATGQLYGDALDGAASMAILFPSRIDTSLRNLVSEAIGSWDPAESPLRFGGEYDGHETALRDYLNAMLGLRDGRLPGPEVIDSLDSLLSPERELRNVLLAYSAAAGGHISQARAHLERGGARRNYRYDLWLDAELHLRTGEYENALLVFSRLLVIGTTSPGSEWLGSPLLLRIAQCHDALGEAEEAAEYYRRFLMYWVDAEPAYQHLARRAVERVEALTGRPYTPPESSPI